jgi:hypothetical protein
MTKDTEVAVSTQAKENMYLVIVEGFQLLSQWTGWVWEQSAWKFSRPAKEWSPFDTDHSKDVSDYEKVMQQKHCITTHKPKKTSVFPLDHLGQTEFISNSKHFRVCKLLKCV